MQLPFVELNASKYSVPVTVRLMFWGPSGCC